MEAQELLVINPLLYGDVDKYIWIDNSVDECRNAQYLFDYLLRRNIYVKGFVSKSPLLIGLKMFNKNILDFDSLDETQAIFFDSNVRPYKANVETRVQRARILNPSIQNEDIIIWGAGITGDKVYQILEEYDLKVKCFIDSDIKKRGGLKYGLPICGPEYLENYGKDIIVVEALEKWKTLDDCIKWKKWKRYHFNFEEMLTDIICNVNGMEKKVFKLSSFWMFLRFVGRTVYIYGNGIIEKEFAKYLYLLDYDFGGFLIDDGEDNENGMCQYIEEILCKDNFYIWIYDKDRSNKLKELGLEFYKQWEFDGCSWDISLNRNQGFDVNLGYTFLADSNHPGIIIYGKDKEEDYKIAVLGDSTTDGMFYSFKSWPQLLYEALDEENITLYNCGVGGYTSGQELIKLIRDVLPLKPDMIIVYNGYQELNVDFRYPLCFPYAKKIYDFARTYMETTHVEYKQNVYKGKEAGLSRFDVWLNNIRNMHAIAVEYNIKFLCFCQPILSCKEGKTTEEKNMLLSMPSTLIDLFMKEYFRKNFVQRKDIPHYIYDFTGIFDNINNVYMDVCHVNEEGNRIIAQKVKDVISDIIL